MGLERATAWTALLTACVLARPATACSCFPEAGRFLTESGDVPADAPGAVWASGADPDERVSFVGERLVAGRGTPVALETSSVGPGWVFVRAKGTAPPGTSYRFTATVRGRSVPVVVRLSSVSLAGVRAPAALRVGPPTRGTLVIADSRGACSAGIDAVARDVSIDLPLEVRGVAGALVYETRVDGEVWRPSSSLCNYVPPGRSWVGRGKDLVFAECGRGRGAKPGRRRVEMRAVVPGRTFAIVARADIELACT